MLIQKIPWDDQLQQLLPQGVLWEYELDSNIDGLILAIQSQLEICQFQLVDLYNDLMPDSTSGTFLEHWERVVGLPNACSSALILTEKERRDNVLGKLNATGGQSRAYYQSIMNGLGYYDNTITEFSSLRIGDECDDFVMGEDWDYTWQVNIASLDEATYQFDTQSECDDFLGTSAGDGYMRCLLTELKPAHTVLLFDYIE